MDVNKSIKKHPHSSIIDDLGGTAAVAKIFSIKNPSVSKWRNQGIPHARLMYLRVKYPKIFKGEDKR